MLTLPAARQVNKAKGASDHDLLLGILEQISELVRIQKNIRDETFNSQVYVMAANAVQVVEDAVTPKYWAVYVSSTSAAGASVRVYREKISTAPAQGSEVVVLGVGEGFRIPGRLPSITLINNGTGSANVIVSALGDANFGKL